ncbi:MAG: SDR family NAD(P)-dependent oxidoreductase [Candidatus Methylomirabilales bacterium]
MTILVTGCAGFVGWQVAEILLREGQTVVGVDDLNDAYDVRLKRWRLEQLESHPHFAFRNLDITDRPALHRLFATAHQAPITNHQSRITAVINLAARAGVRQSLKTPSVYFETNVTGTLNLLEMCREFGVRKFILASTSSIYGMGERPFREDAPTDRPLSPYAASKKAAEVLCHAYHHLYGIDITVFRYFTVYGPAGRPDMSIFRFIKWIAEEEPVILYGDGLQERDFTFVEDIARGTVLGLQPVGFEIVNLGSDRPVKLQQIIKTIERLLGREAVIQSRPSHPADVPATWADISKARRLLGWSPQTTWEEGLEQTVKWYLDNRHWARFVELGR